MLLPYFLIKNVFLSTFVTVGDISNQIILPYLQIGVQKHVIRSSLYRFLRRT